jgi:hypothetical protein
MDKETVKMKLLENSGFVMGILGKKAMDLLFDYSITNEVPFDEIMARQDELDDDFSMLPDDLEDDELDHEHEHEHDHHHEHGHHHDHEHDHEHDHKH